MLLGLLDPSGQVFASAFSGQQPLCLASRKRLFRLRGYARGPRRLNDGPNAGEILVFVNLREFVEANPRRQAYLLIKTDQVCEAAGLATLRKTRDTAFVPRNVGAL